MTSSALRKEYVRDLSDSSHPVVEKPLSRWELVYNQGYVRKTLVVIFLAAAWQLYAVTLNNELLFPALTRTIAAAWKAAVYGELLNRIWISLFILVEGYVIGIVLTICLILIAMSSRLGSDFLETITAMFMPLPAVALLPLALIWFGLGNDSMIFVLVHSVVWAVALNTHSGFRSVSPTLRMVGRNYGLTGIRYTMLILIPAAFPSILGGLKIAWAFAWRTLIAAELVFGVASGSGGLGWYIYENKNVLRIPEVFAGLLTVIMFGLLVENVIFGNVERLTTRRWGMQS
jgi:NitT/TauT family transport system permease protein